MPYTYTSYAMTLDKNGGNTPLGAPTSFNYYITAYQKTLPPYDDFGFTFTFPFANNRGITFLGWRISETIVLTQGSALTGNVSYSTGRTLSFSGGNTANYTQSQLVDAFDALARGAHTAVAVWEESYPITYYDLGSADNSANPALYFPASASPLSVISRPGRTFAGWYADAAFTQSFETSPGVYAIPADAYYGPVSVYAKWTLINYTISYVLNGGTNSGSNPTTYNIESATIYLSSPTRPGYNFGGWFAESDFINVVYIIPPGSNNNFTFYAKWQIINYSLTYNLNGGTNNPANPSTYNVESLPITFSAPTKSGYNFGGWYVDASFITSITGITSGEGNRTLYAKWTAINYSITYNLNGGTNNPANPVSYTIESSFNFADPTRTGYTFGGWYAEGAFTTRVYNIASGSIGDEEVFAKWTPINYTISYVLNNGTNSGSNPASYNIESTTITLANPTRTGYNFGGWYSDSGFVTGSNSIPAGSTGNRTFYAKWTAIVYNIFYQNTFGVTPAPETYTIESATITLPAITRNGYTFGGWFSDAGLITSRTQIVQGSTGSVTVYAKWTIITYTIGYVLNGGTNGANPSTYTVESSPISFINPTRTGYTSNGWYLDSGFTTPVSSLVTGSTGNRVLYAKWTLITYTITYQLDGGSNPSGAPADYNITSATITFLAPTKIGYTFSGWFDAASGGNAFNSIPSGSTGNKTVYARWAIKSAAVALYNRYITKSGTALNVLLKQTAFDFNMNIAITLAEAGGISALNKAKETNYTYTFIGWTRNVNNTVDDAFAIPEIAWDGNAANLLTGVGDMDANLVKGGSYYAVWKRRITGLKVGGNNLKLMIGSSEVKKILRGTTVLWEKENT